MNHVENFTYLIEDFDWHFANIEGEWDTTEDPNWIIGQDLKLKIEEYDSQFVWGVISAYPSGTKPRLSREPYADGNPNFWQGSPCKHLTDSLFEIVCWDCSATLFIGMPNELGLKVKKMPLEFLVWMN